MQARTFYVLPLTVALVAAVTLVACDKRPESETMGQKLDSAVAKVEQKAESTMTKVEQKTDSAIAKVEQKTGQAVDTASTKMKDAAITTRINAELARDTSLSALKINVDTNAGRVALKGTAPSSIARERATVLAQKVDGVVGVDNQLEIKTK